MNFLSNVNIDFLKYRNVFVTLSIALVILGVYLVFFGPGLNVGIDFAGGSQVNLKFAEQQSIDDLRSTLVAGGFDDVQIQSFGEAHSHEVLIRVPIVEGEEGGRVEELIALFDGQFSAGGEFDLNRAGESFVASRLVEIDPDSRLGEAEDDSAMLAYYTDVASAILGQRRDAGVIAAFDDLRGVTGVSDATVDALAADASLGGFAVRGTGSVGPTIGEELREKGFLAVLLSLLVILGYIWLRFELRFGIGAVAAIAHDVLVVLGLYVLVGYEFNLVSIAAFLTLVGYSVNDTVVIFDRVRENMRKQRRMNLVDIMNLSINQSLSRTILTSLTTLMAVGSLLVFGGEVIRGFAFVLTIGVVVGTYSSVYVASPVALLWERTFGATGKEEKQKKAKAAAAATR